VVRHTDEGAGYFGFQSAEGDLLEVTFQLPAFAYSQETGGVIQLDLGFAHGSIKMGEFPAFYFHTDDPVYLAQALHREAWQPIEIWTESDANEVGSFKSTDNFVRTIVPLYNTPSEVTNHLVDYVVRLGNDVYILIFFYVSPAATAEDLLLYDELVAQIALH